GVVTGIAPLTPIQHWFLMEDHQEPHHFNQSILLHIPNDTKPDLLKKAVEELVSHHDALRLRFRAQGAEYDQINHGIDDIVPFSFIDLSTTPKLPETQTFEQIATDFQASLNLGTGPILQVVMFKLGDTCGARLLITIHHLAVDGVSWRILLADLEIIYRQLSSQQPVQLSAKTTAFIDWAKALKDYAQSEILKQELDYWLNQPWSQITSLPLDHVHTQHENIVGSASSISATLDEEETRILLGEVNETYNTQVNDILLSALVLSLEQWTGNPIVVINLEGHGREELFEYVDLSRTVGWFTSLFPVLLQRPLSAGDLSSTIKSIKEQLRAIPNRGIGYGILRYLCEDSTVNQKLQAIPTPEIIFNYLGQFDQEQSETSWRLVPESIGRNRSLTQNRNYLLDINALVVEGKFQVSWTYSKNIHDHTTVEKLSQSYLQAIRSLIEHCKLEDTFGYTPSDFPDAQLDQIEIDEILESLQ
ncbi:MAG: condensation domain-containing protein, partial [Cyanobacteria bacterium J06639_18]